MHNRQIGQVNTIYSKMSPIPVQLTLLSEDPYHMKANFSVKISTQACMLRDIALDSQI